MPTADSLSGRASGPEVLGRVRVGLGSWPRVCDSLVRSVFMKIKPECAAEIPGDDK